jgi:hypothetical protein
MVVREEESVLNTLKDVVVEMDGQDKTVQLETISLFLITLHVSCNVSMEVNALTTSASANRSLQASFVRNILFIILKTIPNWISIS